MYNQLMELDSNKKTEKMNLSDASEEEVVLDILDKPGLISLAKIHGSAQKVYDIPVEFPAESYIFN